MEKFIGFTKELLINKPNKIIGACVMKLVLIGVFKKLLNIYQ